MFWMREFPDEEIKIEKRNKWVLMEVQLEMREIKVGQEGLRPDVAKEGQAGWIQDEKGDLMQ